MILNMIWRILIIIGFMAFMVFCAYAWGWRSRQEREKKMRLTNWTEHSKECRFLINHGGWNCADDCPLRRRKKRYEQGMCDDIINEKES